MRPWKIFLEYITFGSAILLVTLILIQVRGASLGAGFGGAGGGEGSTVRRGSEKTLHQITILLIIIFGLSLIVGFLV